ncbi:TIGR00282 family metallophosphoesterase [Desulfitibacter alkalitolerans]|uniref:TIGR00282 family metallophosphoesterase n=1 Tax=Desulfitibacter alkalitolerans TaxID=264641 RepID=UPI000489D5F4|nr:TIGR00282 family metallophosphoesterase [Desulfitibacter alkalitolerans]
MRFLFIGDIVGRPGRNIVKSMLPQLKVECSPDVVIVNAENAAGGNGLTEQVANELYNDGVDFITLGNHVWDKKDILDFIDREERIVRPANYPPGTPGKGYKVFTKNNIKLSVINLQGRVYMQALECPFRTMDNILAHIANQTNIIIVDIHAEATSEKMALGYYLDGKVSAVLGTHTHIQTADDKILPKGTGYITDVGMTGPYESILGIKKENIIARFLTHMPNRFEVATGTSQLNAVILEVDNVTGKAVSIERLQKYCD